MARVQSGLESDTDLVWGLSQYHQGHDHSPALPYLSPGQYVLCHQSISSPTSHQLPPSLLLLMFREWESG